MCLGNLESKPVREDWVRHLFPVLTKHRPVAHTNLADVVGRRVELGSKEDQRPADLRDVGGEDVLKEVPGLLTSDVKHGNQVGRVHPVPEELEAHARCSVEGIRTWLLSEREPCNSLACTLEDARVWMPSHVDPLDLADGADRVDVLLPHIPRPSQRHLVSLAVEGGTHALKHDLPNLEHAHPGC